MDFLSELGGSDPYKPSIFELIGQEQLRDLLQPALKYVLSVFAQTYPRYLLRIVNKHEEFYALLMFFVERHYLRRYNASFAENFYGLKRRRKPLYETERTNAAVGSHATQLERLRNKDLRLSLMFLVGIPYLRAKAQDYYEALGGGIGPDLLEQMQPSQEATGASRPARTLRDRLRYVFKLVYPWTNIGLELWFLAYNVGYLFDRTAFYRPWLSWMGVDIRRMSAADYRSLLSTTPQRPPTAIPKSTLQKIRRLLLRSPSLFLDSLKVLLPTAIFFIKFLQWWYSPSSPARVLNLSPAGPPVPPPKMLKPHPLGILGQKDAEDVENSAGGYKYGMCPICKKELANATALPTGWVFCYKCVYKEVEEKGKCPVTLLPLGTWTLRKVLI